MLLRRTTAWLATPRAPPEPDKIVAAGGYIQGYHGSRRRHALSHPPYPIHTPRHCLPPRPGQRQSCPPHPWSSGGIPPHSVAAQAQRRCIPQPREAGCAAARLLPGDPHSARAVAALRQAASHASSGAVPSRPRRRGHRQAARAEAAPRESARRRMLLPRTSSVSPPRHQG